MLLALLLSCTPPVDTAPPDTAPQPVDSEAPTRWAIEAADPSPSSAPGVVMLANLIGERLTWGPLLDPGSTVDLDPPEDSPAAFRSLIYSRDGELMWSRSTPGPAQVQEYLSFYSELAGLDLMALFPQLGDFHVFVPRLEGASQLALELRQADGSWLELGRYTLSRIDGQLEEAGQGVTGHETLWQGGPPERSLDIALLGDGYTLDDMARWEADAAALAQRILESEPLASYAHRINLYRVDTPSAEAGVSYDCDECTFRDTAFGSVFAVELVNRLLGTDYRTSAVFQDDQWSVSRAASVVPWDLGVVVANTTHNGGFALHFATAPNNDDTWTDTGVHELGHLLGRLGDEYSRDPCTRSEVLGLPVNITDSPEAPPWAHHLLGDTPLPTPDEEAFDGVVGAFSPAFNCEDLYRPERLCKMKSSSHGDFCAVCAEALVRELFGYVDVVEAVEVELSDDTLRLHVDGEAPLAVRWTLDGALLGEAEGGAWLEVPTSALSISAQGAGTLEMEARHESPFVVLGGEELVERRRFVVSELP